MSSLSDLTLGYIEQSFQPELKVVILRAVSRVFEELQISNYETQLVDIISMESVLSTDDMRDLFISNITTLLYDILSAYKVKIAVEEEPTILELTQLCEVFSLTDNLEDIAPIHGLLYNDMSPRLKIVGIVIALSTIEKQRAMELIEEVDEALIEAIKHVYEDTENNLQTYDGKDKCREVWNLFKVFIGETDCLGVQISEQQFKHEGLNVLVALAKQTTDYTQDDLPAERISQAALDVLSLLIYACDTQKDPMTSFENGLTLMVKDTKRYQVIKETASKIYNDFKLFQTFKTQTKHIEGTSS